MSEDKVYGWLGLARKAGKLVAGDALCEDALARRKAWLIVLASDAGANTVERFGALCEKAGVERILFGTKAELGHRLGRDTYAVIAVLNRSFANQIRKSMEDGSQDVQEQDDAAGTCKSAGDVSADKQNERVYRREDGKKAHGGGVVE